jgi:hypothetical protein
MVRKIFRVQQLFSYEQADPTDVALSKFQYLNLFVIILREIECKWS